MTNPTRILPLVGSAPDAEAEAMTADEWTELGRQVAEEHLEGGEVDDPLEALINLRRHLAFLDGYGARLRLAAESAARLYPDRSFRVAGASLHWVTVGGKRPDFKQDPEWVRMEADRKRWEQTLLGIDHPQRVMSLDGVLVEVHPIDRGSKGRETIAVTLGDGSRKNKSYE